MIAPKPKVVPGKKKKLTLAEQREARAARAAKERAAAKQAEEDPFEQVSGSAQRCALAESSARQKRRLQSLVEEADLEAARDLFGIDGTNENDSPLDKSSLPQVGIECP